jgi:hypothetical protein
VALFSQRKGIRPIEKSIQRESVDGELRNRLWSCLKLEIWDHYSPSDYMRNIDDESQRVLRLVQAIWLNYFKLPLDTIPTFHQDHPKSAYEIIRERFFGGEWWEVYDFVEFVAKHADDKWSARLVMFSNRLLESENSAYRFVGQEIVEITSEHEVAAIESAIQSSTRSVKEHLSRALELLSDRKQPDYRNSIKESISAVESACQVVSGEQGGTLGACLKRLKTKASLHPALEGAFSKLYGYTSDGGGIRHAIADGSDPPTFADAKFMLVACSAFTSFLWTKASESGIDLTAK